MAGDGSTVHVAGELEGERRDLLEALVGVTTDPVFALDGDRQFLAVTEDLAGITGLSTEELLGTDVSTVIDDEAGRLDRMVATVTDQGGTVAGEFQLRTVEGAVKLCELRVTDVAGEAPYTVGCIEDVTGNRRRQERITVLDRVLRHNIRNKVGSIVGYLRAVVDQSETDDAVVALDEATSLLRLSEKARECHRLLEREPTRTRVDDLAELLESVVTQRRDDFPGASISLEATEHPPVVVDKELLAAAVMELVDNAVEHSDRPDPLVQVSVEPAGEWVAVRVADDGPGIPAEERQAILSGEEQPLYHASGLGVWFVKWAVRLVGGQLDIDEREPRGTVVTLRLPAQSAAEASDAAADADD